MGAPSRRSFWLLSRRELFSVSGLMASAAGLSQCGCADNADFSFGGGLTTELT